MTARFAGRLGLQQRVLPNYRVPFFDLLAKACSGGLGVFAGLPRPNEGIISGVPQVAKHAPARNRHILNGALYLCRQDGLTEWLADWNPDALIVEANPRYLTTSSAVHWMHGRGRKVIGWGLGAPPLSGPFRGIRHRRRSHFVHQFDALIAYSQRGAAEYAALGYPSERIFVATNAAAPRPTHTPQRPRPRSGRPSIIFVGRLQARKQVDLLLRACAELKQPRPALVIVGDGPEKPALKALAHRVFPGAQFVGAKHGDELRPYFAAADLFVLPGTGGLAVQEAMVHGLPIVVAKGDGTQDDLVRDSNGWQIPPNDLPALVAALRAALSDPWRLRKMGAESYRIVSEEINLETMVAVFVRALNSLK